MSGRHRLQARRGRRRRRKPILGLAGPITAAAATMTVIGGGVMLVAGDIGPATTYAPPPVSTPAPTQNATPDPGAGLQQEARRATPETNAARSNGSSPSAEEGVPESGSGQFRTPAAIATATRDGVGGGDLITYTVEVEEGLRFRPDAVAQIVDRVLADHRGWMALVSHQLQRVDTDPDFRIRLATPQTVDRLCAPLNTAGRLSCHNGESVVLNAWRWVNGAPTYADDLAGYREYMINHEFGHALGNPHATCPAPGRPAPVMVQQTKGLHGCTANPWPMLG